MDFYKKTMPVPEYTPVETAYRVILKLAVAVHQKSITPFLRR
jgi:hypothetical protein